MTHPQVHRGWFRQVNVLRQTFTAVLTFSFIVVFANCVIIIPSETSTDIGTTITLSQFRIRFNSVSCSIDGITSIQKEMIENVTEDFFWNELDVEFGAAGEGGFERLELLIEDVDVVGTAVKRQDHDLRGRTTRSRKAKRRNQIFGTAAADDDVLFYFRGWAYFRFSPGPNVTNIVSVFENGYESRGRQLVEEITIKAGENNQSSCFDSLVFDEDGFRFEPAEKDTDDRIDQDKAVDGKKDDDKDDNGVKPSTDSEGPTETPTQAPSDTPYTTKTESTSSSSSQDSGPIVLILGISASSLAFFLLACIPLDRLTTKYKTPPQNRTPHKNGSDQHLLPDSFKRPNTAYQFDSLSASSSEGKGLNSARRKTKKSFKNKKAPPLSGHLTRHSSDNNSLPCGTMEARKKQREGEDELLDLGTKSVASNFPNVLFTENDAPEISPTAAREKSSSDETNGNKTNSSYKSKSKSGSSGSGSKWSFFSNNGSSLSSKLSMKWGRGMYHIRPGATSSDVGSIRRESMPYRQQWKNWLLSLFGTRKLLIGEETTTPPLTLQDQKRTERYSWGQLVTDSSLVSGHANSNRMKKPIGRLPSTVEIVPETGGITSAKNPPSSVHDFENRKKKSRPRSYYTSQNRPHHPRAPSNQNTAPGEWYAIMPSLPFAWDPTEEQQPQTETRSTSRVPPPKPVLGSTTSTNFLIDLNQDDYSKISAETNVNNPPAIDIVSENEKNDKEESKSNEEDEHLSSDIATSPSSMARRVDDGGVARRRRRGSDPAFTTLARRESQRRRRHSIDSQQFYERKSSSLFDETLQSITAADRKAQREKEDEFVLRDDTVSLTGLLKQTSQEKIEERVNENRSVVQTTTIPAREVDVDSSLGDSIMDYL